MKSFDKKDLFILGYCVPYVFLSMNFDASNGSAWFYLVTAAAFFVLTAVAINYKNIKMLVIGNLITTAFTMILVAAFQTEKWGWYFKPFSAYSMAAFLSVMAFLVQFICYIRYTQAKRPDKKSLYK